MNEAHYLAILIGEISVEKGNFVIALKPFFFGITGQGEVDIL